MLRHFNVIQDIERPLGLYYRQCSIAMNCRQVARMAAVLANGGRDPIDDQQLLKPVTVQRMLSVMYTCGSTITRDVLLMTSAFLPRADSLVLYMVCYQESSVWRFMLPGSISTAILSEDLSSSSCLPGYRNTVSMIVY